MDLNDYRLIKQGAEAKLKIGMFLGGKKALIKERFSKKYRHPDLDSKLIKDRMRGEIRSLLRCKMLGIRTPTLYHVSVDENTFIMEFIEGQTCRDYINANKSDKDKLMALATAIGQIIGTLHKNNLIHGDLTTSNMLVERSEPTFKLCVIDFGLGYVEGSQEDKGVDLYVLERALISTHPNTEFMFEEILRSYKEQFKDQKKVAEVTKKFEEIRMRGRKRSMLG